MAEKCVRAFVDRIENGWAVLLLEDGRQIDWPADQLPDDSTEGAWISINICVERERLG